MDYSEILIKKLNAQNDLEWFHSICKILERDSSPTTKKLLKILGLEKPNPEGTVRGSKFLIPFDKRFDSISIKPDISLFDSDKPIDFLSFYGKKFALKSIDVVREFPDYSVQINTYDGGSQVFFYPIPTRFEFTALSFDVVDENVKINPQLYFNYIKFHFGNILTQGREGFSMKR
jgi:hypothetical protein